MNIFCTLKDCEKSTKNGQLVCEMHYSRWRRHGTYDISPNWTLLKKGIPHLNNYGYYRIFNGKKRVLEHRYIMEQHLGRKLKKSEKVHHINHIRTDNRIENLELTSSHSEHMKKHHQFSWHNRSISPPIPKAIKQEIISIGNNHIRTRNNKKQRCKVSICSDPMRSKSLCGKHMVWYFKNR